MSTNVHLTPALEKFAKDCVMEGRYNNVSEVVRSGLRLLQEAEERRRFMAMLETIEAEIDRGEVVTHDEMMAQLDAIIEAVE